MNVGSMLRKGSITLFLLYFISEGSMKKIRLN